MGNIVLISVLGGIQKKQRHSIHRIDYSKNYLNCLRKMKEVYRIKNGEMTTQEKVIPIDFGLIFEEDGVFFFDFYIADSFDLDSFIEDDNSFHYEFAMKALTDENNLIEATELSLRNVSPYKSFIRTQSYGYIKHTEKPKNYGNDTLNEDEKDDDEKSQTLFYLELEGLKMEYSDLTEMIKARGGKKIKDFDNFKRDHTNSTLIYNSVTKPGCNNFKFTFFQSENKDNISVELPNYQTDGTNVLYYDIYLEFKRELIYLLSFLNGAEVAVRKEFIGGFYRIGKTDSQTVITYSFHTIKNKNYNDYIPLNSGFHKANHILSFVFMSCFDKYIEENNKLDLNSIIFYLNGTEQSKSIDEKFFVLIIAFERLAKKYVETLNNSDLLVMSEENYQPIKNELLEILRSHKSKENEQAIKRLMPKIGELNKIKRKSTEYKFLKILEYAGIDLTPEIENIINEVRHKAVHQGEFGDGNQGVKNYLVLDELLRDIILNLIGYKNARISRYRFDKKKIG
jgi:hypothetical protein